MVVVSRQQAAGIPLPHGVRISAYLWGLYLLVCFLSLAGHAPSEVLPSYRSLVDGMLMPAVLGLYTIRILPCPCGPQEAPRMCMHPGHRALPHRARRIDDGHRSVSLEWLGTDVYRYPHQAGGWAFRAANCINHGGSACLLFHGLFATGLCQGKSLQGGSFCTRLERWLQLEQRCFRLTVVSYLL